MVASEARSGFTHEKPVSGESVEWYTPAWLFQALGLPFDTDVCSPGMAIVPWIPAAACITSAEDALAPTSRALWRGRVWMNHPYAFRDADWVDLFLTHGWGVGICHARTDTPWCKELIRYCGRTVFTKRVQFVDATGNPPLKLNKKTGKLQKSSPGCGQMLYAMGAECVDAVLRAAKHPKLDGCAVLGEGGSYERVR